MSNPAFNSDDPRLTAFALGELDEQERAEFEQFLESSDEAREALAEIQETIGLLRDELATEPAPSLTAEQRAAVTAEASGEHPALPAAAEPASQPSGRRPWIGVVSAVAAMVLVAGLIPMIQKELSRPLGDPSAVSMRPGHTEHSVAMSPAHASGGFSDTTDDGDCKIIEYIDVCGKDDPATTEEYLKETADFADASAVSRLATEGEVEDSLRGGRQKMQKRRLAGVSSLESKAFETSESGGGLGGSGIGGGGGGGGQVAGNSSSGNPNVATRPSSGNQPGQPGEKSRDRSQIASVRRELGQDGSSSDAPATVPSVPRPPVGGESRLDTLASTGRASKFGGTKAKPSAASDDSGQGAPEKSASLAGTALPGRGGERDTRQGQSNQSQVVTESKNGTQEAGEPAVFGGVDSQRVADKTDQPGKRRAKSSRRPNSAEASTPRPVAEPAPADETRPATLTASTAPAAGPKTVPAGGTAADPFRAQPKPQSTPPLVADAAPRADSETVPGQQLAANTTSLRGTARRKLPAKKELEERVFSFYLGFGRGRTATSPQQLYRETDRKPLPRSTAYNEAYDKITENQFVRPIPLDTDTCLSTFSVDVDTASYANVRRFLDQGQFPPKNAVRTEELINYFSYDYPQPEGDEPFSVNVELNLCPWKPQHRLARIGLQAKNLDDRQRPPTNLVFLIDTSGSMRAENKLPLVRASMNMLINELTEDDQVAIVTYSNTADLRLPATSGAKKSEISSVIDGLKAGGSTNGAGGIQLAYDTAIRKYIDGGANRVIICTDGDFNVGISDDDKLVDLIQEKAASGVFLSVFGFGMGNLKDAKLEKLADKGNGHYGYIDSQGEAKKVFSHELTGTLFTVAKDVKAQVEFNPEKVGAYRLIGYENRVMAAQDFTDDTKDAGEIGAGHRVTALYEIIPKSELIDQPDVEPLKYGGTDAKGEESDNNKAATNELFTLRLRYKLPDEETSVATARNYPVQDISIRGRAVAPTQDFIWAAAVASFGLNLRESEHRGNFTFREVLAMAQRSVGEDEHGRRRDFVNLVTKAARLAGQGGELEAPEVDGPVARPSELDAAASRIKAGVDGRYRRLLKKIEVRDDFRRFRAFHDYGFWDGVEYAGHKDLLPGFWVYVYPHWYIWGEETKLLETPAPNTPQPLDSPEDPAGSQPPVDGDAPEASDPPPEKTKSVPTTQPEASTDKSEGSNGN